MLCRALKHIFSTATATTGRGHITRSSISRVMPNSCESGSATAAMPLNMMATAIKPGSRQVGKNIGKDKQEQQRLHDDADHKRSQLAPQYAQVAQHQAQEG